MEFKQLKQFALAASALVATLASTSCTVDRFEQDGKGGYQRVTYGVTPSDVTNLAMVAGAYALGNKHLSNQNRNSQRYYNSFRNRGGCGNGGGLGNRPNFIDSRTLRCAAGGEYINGGGVSNFGQYTGHDHN